jgi:hypothetical protein
MIANDVGSTKNTAPASSGDSLCWAARAVRKTYSRRGSSCYGDGTTWRERARGCSRKGTRGYDLRATAAFYF